MNNIDTTQLLIDRTDYMPVYRQVKQAIKRQIRAKKIRPGKRIGSVVEMARTIGLKKLAGKASVSTRTVIRYLSGNGYVSEETGLRIEKLVREHNYYPRAIARSLRNRGNRD